MCKSKGKGRKIEADLLIAIITACFVFAMVMAYTIPMIWNPMRRPGPMPTNYVLSLTPLGTHMDDVVNIVENHRDWRIWGINHERGFSHPQLSRIPEIRSEGGHIIGDKSIAVGGGYYRPVGLISRTVVAIYYAFDEDGYLIEVYVRRSTAM